MAISRSVGMKRSEGYALCAYLFAPLLYSLYANLDNSHFILLRILMGCTLAQCSFVITCT